MPPCAAVNDALALLGYQHHDVGAFDRVYPFFHKPALWPATHHVHLRVGGSNEERGHLAFRDRLRAQPDLVVDYAASKRKLATLHDDSSFASREACSLAKSEFALAVLAGAFAVRYRVPPADTR